MAVRCPWTADSPRRCRLTPEPRGMCGDRSRLRELPLCTWWNRRVTSPVRTARLIDEQQSAVLALVAAAQEQDGVAPMSEQSLLAARGRSGRPVEHLLAYADDGLVGYLQVDEGEETPSAELVVAPSHRRQGVGSELLSRIRPGTRIWAHGDLAASDAFAAAHGLEVVRELFVLGLRFAEAGPAGRRRGGVAAGQRRGVRAPRRAGPHDPRRPRRSHGGVLVRPRGADPGRARGRPRHGGRLPLDETTFRD